MKERERGWSGENNRGMVEKMEWTGNWCKAIGEDDRWTKPIEERTTVKRLMINGYRLRTAQKTRAYVHTKPAQASVRP